MTLRALLACLVLALPARLCAADTAHEAAELYRAGQFEAAAQAYEQLSASAPANAYYLYDLGNSYYKLNRLGPAVLNYQRAFELQPRDPDIRANLSFAMKKAGNELVPAGIPEVLHAFYHYLSAKELWGLFCLFCWLAGLSGAACIWPARRRPWLVRLALAAAGLAAASGLWVAARSSTGLKNPAVVMQSKAEVRTGPGDNFTAAASVPEGHTVEVLESKDDWTLIGIRRENIKGWVKTAAIERI